MYQSMYQSVYQTIYQNPVSSQLRHIWDEVKYCGEKCQRNRPAATSALAAA
jgi:hypothetical protein